MSIKAFTSMRLNLLSILLSSTLFFTACNLLYDEGEWVTEQRNTKSFQQINIKCVADVYYYQSKSFYLDIHFYKKHLNNIHTTIENNKLNISNNFNAQWFTDIQKLRIDIYAPSLNKVKIEQGAGFFCNDTLHTNSFHFSMQGDVFESKIIINTSRLNIKINNAVGLLKVKGKANYTKTFNRGETRIMAQTLHADSLEIIHQSVMNGYYSVKNWLKYQILRNGDLYIYGQPEINGEALGSGKLIVANEN